MSDSQLIARRTLTKLVLLLEKTIWDTIVKRGVVFQKDNNPSPPTAKDVSI